MTEVQGIAYENNSGVLRMQLRQEPTAAQLAAGTPGDPVPKSAITLTEFTLKDEINKTIINSRDAVDVLANISTNGFFEMLLNPEDFVINHPTQSEEIHVAILKIQFTGRLGAMTIERTANIHVKNDEFIG